VPDDAGSSWKIKYDYWGDDYLKSGYYSTSGTTWKEDNATELAGIDHSGIDLTLLKQKGMLSFPVRSKDGHILIISM